MEQQQNFRTIDSKGRQGGSWHLYGMFVANQLFSVLIYLRLGLLVVDECMCVFWNQWGYIYSHLLTTLDLLPF